MQILSKEIDSLTEALGKSDNECKRLIETKRSNGKDNNSRLKNKLTDLEIENKTLRARVAMLERKLSLEEDKTKQLNEYNEHLKKINKELEEALNGSLEITNSSKRLLEGTKDDKTSDVISTVLTFHEKTPTINPLSIKINKVKVSNIIETMTTSKTDDKSIKKLEYNVIRTKTCTKGGLIQLNKYYTAAKDAIVALKSELGNNCSKENLTKQTDNWISIITKLKEGYENELQTKSNEIQKLQIQLANCNV